MPGRLRALATLAGAAVSFAMETLQSYLPVRIPSNVDLALNAAGTFAGAALAAGLERAAETVSRERLRDAERRPLVILLTDGRSTSGPAPAESANRLRAAGVASVVVDTEEGNIRLGLAREVANALGARCMRLDELRSESLVEVVERRRAA